jgi:hypothetical protein
MNADHGEQEIRDWLGALDYVFENGGPSRVHQLLSRLAIHARKKGGRLPYSVNTPYVNTIPPHEEPVCGQPGNRAGRQYRFHRLLDIRSRHISGLKRSNYSKFAIVDSQPAHETALRPSTWTSSSIIIRSRADSMRPYNYDWLADACSSIPSRMAERSREYPVCQRQLRRTPHFHRFRFRLAFTPARPAGGRHHQP